LASHSFPWSHIVQCPSCRAVSQPYSMSGCLSPKKMRKSTSMKHGTYSFKDDTVEAFSYTTFTLCIMDGHLLLGTSRLIAVFKTLGTAATMQFLCTCLPPKYLDCFSMPSQWILLNL
jgi:hypothetical protein